MWAVFPILLCCMLGSAVAGKCGVSAPEVPLNEIASYCNSVSRSRTPECTAAMHRFCGRVKFPTPRTTLGVPREFGTDELEMSCVKTGVKRDVPIGTLRHYNSRCIMTQSQGKECMQAINKYCTSAYGFLGFGAGLSQEAGHNVLGVHCFKPTLMQNVKWNDVKKFVPDCRYPDTASIPCFAAAKRWCVNQGHRGGIPQSFGSHLMKVACYNDEFTNNVSMKRDGTFYNRKAQIQKTCSYKQIGNMLVLDYINGLGAEKTTKVPVG